MANLYEFELDGPLFRRQREWLCRIAEEIRRHGRYAPQPGDLDLIEGLINATDAIADQAHDRHGIDCLLIDEDGSRCKCEKPGASDVPGQPL